MKYLLCLCFTLFFISCSKSHDYGIACEGKISGGTRLIWFDWDNDSNKFVFIDTLSIVKDITVNSVVYKNEYETGYRYLFKLKDLGFSFTNGQKFDDLAVSFIEYNDKDSLDSVFCPNFAVGCEKVDIEKIADCAYLFKMIGQDIDSMKMLSGRYPNAGMVFIDTEILLRIKE